MKSFEELCLDNYSRIYKYVFALTGSRETAEDLIQDVFTVAFEKGEAFLSHANPPAFLYKTARNLSYSYLKRAQRQRAEALEEDYPDGDADLCDKLLNDRDRRIDETVYTEQVIERLEPKQRTLYSLRYIDRKPIREIAAEQGTTEPAMRMRLVRLRREITDAVKELKLDEL